MQTQNILLAQHKDDFLGHDRASGSQGWGQVSHGGWQGLEPSETFTSKNMMFVGTLSASIHTDMGRGAPEQVLNFLPLLRMEERISNVHLSFVSRAEKLPVSEHINGTALPIHGC